MKQIIIITILTISFNNIFACDCTMSKITINDIKDIDIIFIGKVIDVGFDSIGNRSFATFLITKPLKANQDFKDTVQIFNPEGNACGYHFDIGNKWYLWAKLSDNKFESRQCNHSQLRTRLKAPKGTFYMPSLTVFRTNYKKNRRFHNEKRLIRRFLKEDN